MKKPDNIVVVNTTQEGLFSKWLEILTPYHHLTEKERQVASALLYRRFQLEKSIVDNDLLDKISLNNDTKEEIRESLGISKQHFMVILSTLKSKKFIEEDRINPRFIPNIGEGNKFMLLFFFNIEEDARLQPSVSGNSSEE